LEIDADAIAVGQTFGTGEGTFSGLADLAIFAGIFASSAVQRVYLEINTGSVAIG
jgi:hypothetical protein